MAFIATESVGADALATTSNAHSNAAIDAVFAVLPGNARSRRFAVYTLPACRALALVLVNTVAACAMPRAFYPGAVVDVRCTVFA